MYSPTREMAAPSFNEAVQIFGKDSVRLLERADGSIGVIVGSPRQHNTTEATKAEAILKEQGISLDNSLIDDFLSKVRPDNPYIRYSNKS